MGTECLEAGLGKLKGMKMPFVASEACWRKTVELLVGWFEGVVGDKEGSGNWRMSIGMLRRWQAKIAFMMGMY